MIRECTGFHRAHSEQDVAALHSGNPPAQLLKLFSPSTASTMSINFSLFGATFKQNPPVGPLLDFNSPFRAICCRIFARKCAGICSSSAMFFTIAKCPSG